jgi:hypothetical protein
MSQSPATASEPHCPECGAAVKSADMNCWLCHRPLVVTAELVEPGSPFAGRPAPPKWVNPAQFSLETLMLVITLIAVCLGMVMALPGLGVLVAIVAAPALVRTLIAGYQDRKAGTPMTLGEKLLTFLASTGVTVAVLVTGGTAFAAACAGSLFVACGLEAAAPGRSVLGGRTGELLLYALLGVSALVGLGTAGWLFWVLRPRRAS